MQRSFYANVFGGRFAYSDYLTISIESSYEPIKQKGSQLAAFFSSLKYSIYLGILKGAEVLDLKNNLSFLAPLVLSI